MPTGVTICHTCGKKGPSNYGYLPRRKQGTQDSEANAWWFYCNVCAREFNVEEEVNRWEKKFYCGHCWQNWDGEVYVEHVKTCLNAAMIAKKRMAVIQFWNRLGTKVPPTARVPADGSSQETNASTPDEPDSGTPLQPA